FVQNQSCSLRRAQAPKPRAPVTWVVLPSTRQDDGFKIGDRLDLIWVASGAIKADGPSPVMPDQCDILCELQRFEPRVHVARMIDETVSLTWRLSGPTHANQIGRQAPTMRTDIRND